MSQALACRVCGQIQTAPVVGLRERLVCARCGVDLPGRAAGFGLQRTAAFTLAALLLYVPANLYPILEMDYVGARTENTLWSGCVALARQGSWAIAAIVFCASILVPAIKLAGLLFLATTLHVRARARDRHRIHRILEAIGRWSMLDVFLLSILVALVRLGDLASVVPGPGALFFCGVVVFSLLATASFEPRWLWETGDV